MYLGARSAHISTIQPPLGNSCAERHSDGCLTGVDREPCTWSWSISPAPSRKDLELDVEKLVRGRQRCSVRALKPARQILCGTYSAAMRSASAGEGRVQPWPCMSDPNAGRCPCQGHEEG